MTSLEVRTNCRFLKQDPSDHLSVVFDESAEHPPFSMGLCYTYPPLDMKESGEFAVRLCGIERYLGVAMIDNDSSFVDRLPISHVDKGTWDEFDEMVGKESGHITSIVLVDIQTMHYHYYSGTKQVSLAFREGTKHPEKPGVLYWRFYKDHINGDGHAQLFAGELSPMQPLELNFYKKGPSHRVLLFAAVERPDTKICADIVKQ